MKYIVKIIKHTIKNEYTKINDIIKSGNINDNIQSICHYFITLCKLNLISDEKLFMIFGLFIINGISYETFENMSVNCFPLIFDLLNTYKEYESSNMLLLTTIDKIKNNDSIIAKIIKEKQSIYKQQNVNVGNKSFMTIITENESISKQQNINIGAEQQNISIGSEQQNINIGVEQQNISIGTEQQNINIETKSFINILKNDIYNITLSFIDPKFTDNLLLSRYNLIDENFDKSHWENVNEKEMLERLSYLVNTFSLNTLKFMGLRIVTNNQFEHMSYMEKCEYYRSCIRLINESMIHLTEIAKNNEKNEKNFNNFKRTIMKAMMHTNSKTVNNIIYSNICTNYIDLNSMIHDYFQ